MTAWPNLLKGSNGPLTTTFHTNSSQNLTLEVSVYTVAGELVAKIQGPSGTNQAAWDASGLASGIYLALVNLTASNGTHLGRQVLKMAVIR